MLSILLYPTGGSYAWCVIPEGPSVLTTVAPTSAVSGAAGSLRPNCSSPLLTCLGSSPLGSFCSSLLWSLPSVLTSWHAQEPSQGVDPGHTGFLPLRTQDLGNQWSSLHKYATHLFLFSCSFPLLGWEHTITGFPFRLANGKLSGIFLFLHPALPPQN